ncbi:MAG: hypothetical protein M0R06_01360 [Sphaerochaeta sp.]|nr:hypothetical protein [Sphaerochaeta sp.]
MEIDAKYQPYVMMIERNKKNKQTGEWEKMPPQPYMTVDGRVAMQRDAAAEKPWSILTWANPGGESLVLRSDGTEILVPAGHVVALFVDEFGGKHSGTAEIIGVMASDKSAIENGETSAIGRALGAAGIGLIPGQHGLASADEMVTALAPQTPAKKVEPPKATPKAEPASDDNTARARAYVVSFSKKYPNQTLGQIWDTDKHYVEWIATDFDAKGDENNVKVKAAAKYLFETLVK